MVQGDTDPRGAGAGGHLQTPRQCLPARVPLVLPGESRGRGETRSSGSPAQTLSTAVGPSPISC